MDRPVEHEGGDSVDVVAVVDQVMALRRHGGGWPIAPYASR
jgi:hypothetical protein